MHARRFLLACCGDGLVRVLNPHNGVVISVLVSRRERDSRKAYGKVEGSGAGGTDTAGNKRSPSILDGVELPCTCAAFRPHNKVGGTTSANRANLSASHETRNCRKTLVLRVVLLVGVVQTRLLSVIARLCWQIKGAVLLPCCRFFSRGTQTIEFEGYLQDFVVSYVRQYPAEIYAPEQILKFVVHVELLRLLCTCLSSPTSLSRALITL